MKVTDYMEDFVEALANQLDSDEERWGDTWTKRLRLNQEERVMNDINDYYDQWKHAGTPIPWLKIIGNCMIAWIRENNQDLFPE